MNLLDKLHIIYTPDGLAVAGLRKPETCRRSKYG